MTDDNKTLDPFDPSALRLPNDFGSTTGVKKLLTRVPVGKPSKESWFRVHPGEDYRGDFGIIDLKDENEIYLVTPDLQLELSELIVPASLYTTITRQGVLSLWRVRLPKDDEKDHTAWQSAREAVSRATQRWTRIQWNFGTNAYDIYEATGITVEPDWPDVSFRDILETAFKDSLVSTADHPVIRKLRGFE
jgi:hypothetical protein